MDAKFGTPSSPAMPTKNPTFPKDDLTEADFWAALRDYDERVAVIQRRMAERDKKIEQSRKSSRACLARIKKMLAKDRPAKQATRVAKHRLKRSKIFA